jgi:hypothetical protein
MKLDGYGGILMVIQPKTWGFRRNDVIAMDNDRTNHKTVGEIKLR